MPISRKKSCVRCRRSKLRCNQATPSCSRCSERGTRCVYDCDVNRGAPYPQPSGLRTSEGLPDSQPPSIFPLETSALSASGFMDDQIQATDISSDILGMDLNPITAFGENPFGTPKISPSLDISNVPLPFSAWTSVPDSSGPEVEVSGVETMSSMPSHLNNSNPWLSEDTVASSGSNSTSHIPASGSTQLLPSRRTFHRRNTVRRCALSSIVLGQLTSFPKMMIQGSHLPPFISPPCHLHEEMAFDCAKSRRHQCLPKELAICAGLVESFYSRTAQNTDFVWKTIYAEAERLHCEHETYDVHQQLAALQATTIYALLQAQDVDTGESNGAYALLRTVIDISTSVTQRSQLGAETFPEPPIRHHWIHKESVNRTLVTLMIVDLLLEGLVEPQRSAYRSLCDHGIHKVPLLASRDLWEAPTNFIWRTEYEKYLSRRKTRRVLRVEDLVEVTEGGSLKNLSQSDERFEIVPDIYNWCEGLDSLASLLWMVIPFQQRRMRPGMTEVW